MSTTSRTSDDQNERAGLTKKGLWFPAGLWADVEASAARHGRSPTQEVVLMVRRCLEAGDAWQLGLDVGELPRRGRPPKDAEAPPAGPKRPPGRPRKER
jgi:hypothetical protein